MGFQSIVHERILVDRDIEESKEFIKSIGNDDWTIRTEMFGLGINEVTYYEDLVLVFGATYKQIEDNWTTFILKFEHVLRNVGFDTAKIQLETEMEGTYNFFWISKHNKPSFEKDYHLIETDEWYFGYGQRHRFGILERDLIEEEIFKDEGFKYPIIFSTEQVMAFKELLDKLDMTLLHEKQFPEFDGAQYNLIYPILSKFSFEKKMYFDFDRTYEADGAHKSSVFYIKLIDVADLIAIPNTI